MRPFCKVLLILCYSVPVSVQGTFINSRAAWLWQNHDHSYFGQYFNHDYLMIMSVPYDQNLIRLFYLIIAIFKYIFAGNNFAMISKF